LVLVVEELQLVLEEQYIFLCNHFEWQFYMLFQWMLGLFHIFESTAQSHQVEGQHCSVTFLLWERELSFLYFILQLLLSSEGWIRNWNF
jgi:hypothetical protein